MTHKANLHRCPLESVQQSRTHKQLWEGEKETTNPHRGNSECSMNPDTEVSIVLHHPLLWTRTRSSPGSLCSTQALGQTDLCTSRPVTACPVSLREGTQQKQQIRSTLQSTERP
ncbi:NHP2-like protein 1 [Cricetulus griseus]|uniref:NHP2-like protein 1 n=1 Tax=Cricetulus griseus TaxID=10029 RepID=A0A9J7JHP9_CRIGR|nr:NHP2-like protein 1 [Cricetulus griseus]